MAKIKQKIQNCIRLHDQENNDPLFGKNGTIKSIDGFSLSMLIATLKKRYKNASKSKAENDFKNNIGQRKNSGNSKLIVDIFNYFGVPLTHKERIGLTFDGIVPELRNLEKRLIGRYKTNPNDSVVVKNIFAYIHNSSPEDAIFAKKLVNEVAIETATSDWLEDFLPCFTKTLSSSPKILEQAIELLQKMAKAEQNHRVLVKLFSTNLNLTCKFFGKTLFEKNKNIETIFNRLNAHSEFQALVYQRILFVAGEDSNNQKRLSYLQGLAKDKPNLIYEKKRYQTAKANAIYQQFLKDNAIRKALSELDDNLDSLLFDAQGRLVIELSLKDIEEQFKAELLNNLRWVHGFVVNQEGEEITDEAFHSNLKKLLGGRTPKARTLCSIDVTQPSDKDLERLYKKYRNVYGNEQEKFPSYLRGSINPSFEEVYSHVCLMTRSLKRVTEGLNKYKQYNLDWGKIRQNVAVIIQIEIAEKFREEVDRLRGHDIDNIEELNKKLSKSRELLVAKAKEKIFEELVQQLKDNDHNENQIKSYLQNIYQNIDKHTFTQQTATGFDYFHTSDYFQQGTYISGTNDTAHNKPLFKENLGIEDQVAFRRAVYTYIDKKGNLQATNGMNSRVPSPAVIFTGEKKNEIKSNLDGVIEDVKKKFGFLHAELKNMRGGKPGPVVENLFTSFNSHLYDTMIDSQNRQRLSALLIMNAMHQFNAEKISDLKKGEVNLHNYIFVQNIATNRHTKDLGYRHTKRFPWLSGSVELDEITLISEMAFIHTLNENKAYLSPEIRKLLMEARTKVYKAYDYYLRKDNKEKYFAQSDEGLYLIFKIGELKQELQKTYQISPEFDLEALASQTVVCMFANNKHWNYRYGNLSQALSMYIEWAKTGGCKSGNERNEDVMKRFALLKSLHERVNHGGYEILRADEKDIYTSMQVYVNNPSKSIEKLREIFSKALNNGRAHGAEAAISREDQGAPSKIAPFSWLQNIKNPGVRWASRILLAIPISLGAFLRIPWCKKQLKALYGNTNDAADKELRAINAKGARGMQAHKKQPEKVRSAIVNVLKNKNLLLGKQDEIEFKNGLKKAQISHEVQQKNTILIKSTYRSIGEKIQPENKIYNDEQQTMQIEKKVLKEKVEKIKGNKQSFTQEDFVQNHNNSISI